MASSASPCLQFNQGQRRSFLVILAGALMFTIVIYSLANLQRRVYTADVVVIVLSLTFDAREQFPFAELTSGYDQTGCRR